MYSLTGGFAPKFPIFLLHCHHSCNTCQLKCTQTLIFLITYVIIPFLNEWPVSSLIISSPSQTYEHGPGERGCHPTASMLLNHSLKQLLEQIYNLLPPPEGTLQFTSSMILICCCTKYFLITIGANVWPR